ncbi:hypothetical protein [Acidiphilium sp.]|nr:hypothetical protein [Acidiphilium sp.]
MNRPFRIILAAETIAMVGSQVTLWALPLTAVRDIVRVLKRPTGVVADGG